MKGLKKLALASAVLALSTGAFAMEALQDDALASTTGQAGLTITTNNTNITAAAVRYYDADGANGLSAGATTVFITSDGTSTGTTLPGPCGGITNVACVANFSLSGTGAGGSVNIAGFKLTEGSSTTTIDVGSTGTTSTDTSGLLIGATANNLNVALGGISFDNGSELNGTLTLGFAATNATTTYDSSGFLATGSDIGGVAITGITLPKSLMLISAGAASIPALGWVGSSSGLTITNLIPISNLALTVNYYNTNMESFKTGAFVANVGGGFAAGDGLISLPINLLGVLTGPIEIAVGKKPVDAFNTGAGEGLDVLMTGTGITALDIGGHDLGHGGIQIAGTNAGSVAILGLVVGPQVINISGH